MVMLPMREARFSAILGLMLLVMAGCGGESPAQEVRLLDLVRQVERFDGERIVTAGIVRSHPDPEHYWIEDEELNRVEIRPGERIAAHLGDRVQVTGRFSYAPDAGRVIEAEAVEVSANR